MTESTSSMGVDLLHARGHAHTAGLAIALLALVGGCRKGPVLTGPPSAGDGVRFELVEWQYDDEELELGLRVTNELGGPVLVDKNQLAVIGPDGIALYHDEGHDTVSVAPGETKRIDFDVEATTYVFKDTEGVYVRFDGVYLPASAMRLNVPPMALGQPTNAPGDSPTLPMPKGARASGVVAAVREAVAPSPRAGASKGLEEYQGPRRKIKALGAKVAAMPLRASEVPEQVAFILDELLLTELQAVGFEAIGPDDISAMVGFEGMKDQMGCDEASCVAEIGNALGVPYLTAGNVTNLEGSTVLTLKLIDVKNSSVVARVSKIADGGSKVLPRVIAEAVQEMVSRGNL